MRVDYIGISLLALGVGALQVLLDKGQEDDWFGSHFIVTLIVISAVSLIALVLWELHQKHPIIDVRMFKSFNFAVANLMMFFLGVLLFSSLVMMPQFLQTLMGYTAQSAGLVLSGGGLVMLFEMPIVGQLTTKYPAKYIMAFGWLALAFGMYYSTVRIDMLISFRSAAGCAWCNHSGLAFCSFPSLWRATSEFPPEKGNSVSGSGEFHAQYRQQRGDLHGHDNAGAAGAISPVRVVASHHSVRSGFSEPGEGFEPATGPLRRQRCRTRQAGLRSALPIGAGQSQTLAYIDTFMVLAIAAGIMFVLAFIVRKNDPDGGRRSCGG